MPLMSTACGKRGCALYYYLTLEVSDNTVMIIQFQQSLHYIFISYMLLILQILVFYIGYNSQITLGRTLKINSPVDITCSRGLSCILCRKCNPRMHCDYQVNHRKYRLVFCNIYVRNSIFETFVY